MKKLESFFISSAQAQTKIELGKPIVDDFGNYSFFDVIATNFFSIIGTMIVISLGLSGLVHVIRSIVARHQNKSFHKTRDFVVISIATFIILFLAYYLFYRFTVKPL